MLLVLVTSLRLMSTIIHWIYAVQILTDTSLHGILIDVGLPIMHRGCRYNSRAIILDGKLLCILAKIYLANDGLSLDALFGDGLLIISTTFHPQYSSTKEYDRSP